MRMRLAPLAQKPNPTTAGKRKPQRRPFTHSYVAPTLQPPWARWGQGQAELLPKLEIGNVNDPLERQADSIADQVMRMRLPARGVSDGVAPGSDAELEADDEDGLGENAIAGPLFENQPSSGGASVVVHRKCAKCDSEEDEVHRSVGDAPEMVDDVENDDDNMREPFVGWWGGPTSGKFAERLRERIWQGGRPLPALARNFLERRLGADLGDVRVHDDPSADSLAGQINARAFTIGKNIFFGSGELTPSTQGSGMRLLAHEVAHTLQNAGIANALPLPMWAKATPNHDVVRRAPPTELESEPADSLENAPVLTEIEIGEEYAVFIGRDAAGQIYRVPVEIKSRPLGLEERSYPATITGRGAFAFDGTIEDVASHEFRITFENPKKVVTTFRWEVNAKLTIEVVGADVDLDFPAGAQTEVGSPGTRQDLGYSPLDPGRPVRDLLALPVDEGVQALIDEDLRQNGPIPEDVRAFMFSEGAPSLFHWTSSNAEHVLRAARLIQQMSEQERLDYLARAQALPERRRSWSGFADGLQKYVEEQHDRIANVSSLSSYVKFFSDAPDNAPQWYYNYHPREGGPGNTLAHGFLSDWLNSKPNPLTPEELVDFVAGYAKRFRREAAQIGLSVLDHAEVEVVKEIRRFNDRDVVADLTTLLESDDMQLYIVRARSYERKAKSKRSLGDGQSEVYDGMARRDTGAAREALAAAHPILADEDFDVAEAVEEKSGQSVAKWAIARLKKRSRQIEDLRGTFQDDSEILSVLQMDYLLDRTFASLGIVKSDVAAGFIMRYRDRLANQETLRAIAVAAAEIFAGILATVLGGPIGTALAVGSLASSAYTASKDIDNYLTQSAAHDLGLAAHSPSAFWVALSIAAVGIDAASVAKAVVGPLRAFDSGLKTFDGDSIADAAALRRKLDGIEGVDAEEAEELAKLAEARRTARQTSVSRMERLQIDPRKVDADFYDWLDGLEEVTILRLEKPDNRWLVDALVEMDPGVRRILTKCASDCLPAWLKTDGFEEFVKRMQKLEKRARGDWDTIEAMRTIFHSIKEGQQVIAEAALETLENAGNLKVAAKKLAAEYGGPAYKPAPPVAKPASEAKKPRATKVEEAIKAGTLPADGLRTDLLRITEQMYDPRNPPSTLEAAVRLLERALEKHGKGWVLNTGENAHRVGTGMRYDQRGGYTVVRDWGDIEIYDADGTMLLELLGKK